MTDFTFNIGDMLSPPRGGCSDLLCRDYFFALHAGAFLATKTSKVNGRLLLNIGIEGGVVMISQEVVGKARYTGRRVHSLAKIAGIVFVNLRLVIVDLRLFSLL